MYSASNAVIEWFSVLKTEIHLFRNSVIPYSAFCSFPKIFVIMIIEFKKNHYRDNIFIFVMIIVQWQLKMLLFPIQFNNHTVLAVKNRTNFDWNNI